MNKLERGNDSKKNSYAVGMNNWQEVAEWYYCICKDPRGPHIGNLVSRCWHQFKEVVETTEVEPTGGRSLDTGLRTVL